MKIALIALSTIVAAVMIFFIGVHVGGYQSVILRSSAEAAFSAQILRDLRQNRIEPLIATQEAILDGALYSHSYYLQHGYPSLFVFLKPWEKHFDHRKILTEAVLYRREHPSVVDEVMIENSDNPEGWRDMRERIDTVLKTYGEGGV